MIAGGNSKIESSWGDDTYFIAGDGNNRLADSHGEDTYVFLGNGDNLVSDGFSNDIYVMGGGNDIISDGTVKRTLNVSSTVTSWVWDNDLIAMDDSDYYVNFYLDDFYEFRQNGEEFNPYDFLTVTTMYPSTYTPSIETSSNDTYYLGAGDDILFDAYGLNQAYGGDGNDIMMMGYSDDLAAGEDGDDQIYGSFGNDNLYGGAGQDFIDGGADSDVIFGDEGNDKLLGGDGLDYIAGGDGSDIIIGGEGADVLYGGAGTDFFLYEAITDAGDLIKDFAVGEGDALDLSALLSGFYDELQDSINDFVFASESAGNTVVSVDLSGSGDMSASVALMTLEGVTGVSVDQLISGDNLLV